MGNKKLHSLNEDEIFKRLGAKAEEVQRSTDNNQLNLTITDAAEALGCSRRTIFRNRDYLLNIMRGWQPGIEFVKRVGYKYIVT